METNSIPLQIENIGNQWTMRLGQYTGQGQTPQAAFTALAQRIEGLTQAQSTILWETGQQGVGASRA